MEAEYRKPDPREQIVYEMEKAFIDSIKGDKTRKRDALSLAERALEMEPSDAHRKRIQKVLEGLGKKKR